MAGSVNKVIIVGHLGKDPEVRFLPDGTKIAGFSVATSESWKDKTSGERKDKTEWHKIAIMNERIAEVAEKYLRKGSKVYLEGQLHTQKWTDKNGQERYTTEVVLGKFRGELVLLDSKESNSGPAEAYPGADDYMPPRQPSPPAVVSHYSELDDEVPF